MRTLAHLGGLVLIAACGHGSPPGSPASQPAASPTGPTGPTGPTVSSAGAAPASRPAAPDERWLGAFPVYRGARLLCQEHVLGQGMEIDWRSFASGDTPETVAAFYGATRDATTGMVRVRASDDRILSIHAPGDSYPTCNETPREGERTVIVVSQAHRSR